MIRLQNNRNIVVTFENLILQPFESIDLTEKQFAKLYEKREIRESISLSYLKATKIQDNVKKSKKGDK